MNVLIIIYQGIINFKKVYVCVLRVTNTPHDWHIEWCGDK